MGLYQKMHNVMVGSGALDKSMVVGTGTNSYKAISESAVLNVIKPLLKENGLVIFPIKCVVDETHTEYQGKYGLSQRFLTKLVATYKIVDIETGESETLETIGYGTDTQDKGSGQAMTYAYKALLSKTFCLFSGEDSDNVHSDQKDKDSSLSNPTNIKCTDLINVGHKKGYNAKAIETSLVKAYGRGMEYITQAEHDETLAKLTALPDKE